MGNNISVRNIAGVVVFDIKLCGNTKYNVWVKEMPGSIEVIPAVIKYLLSKKESSSLLNNEELFSMKIFKELYLTCTYIGGAVDSYVVTSLELIVLGVVFEEYRRLAYYESGANMTTVGKALNMWSNVSDVCERIISDGVREKLLSDKTAMKGVVLC